MPGELLLKARIYPLSLREIANKYGSSLKFSRENYDTWKVEIAVGALSSLLEELWKTQKALLMYDRRLPHKFQETGHDPYHIRTEWQALVPLALAVHLHGNFPSPRERVGVNLDELFREKLKSAIEAVKSLNVSDAEASTAINEFLSLFREWAENVATNPSQRKGYNDILEEVNNKLENVFPVEEVRRHIAAFVSDLLRLVSVTEEELGTSFQAPINEFFNQLKGTYVSLLQRDVWDNMFPFNSIANEDLKQFSFEFFPWILIVRYYLNKMTGNVRGSLWRELMEDPNKTLGAGAAWGSNLPALLWGSLYPSERQEESPNDRKLAEEAISSPSAIAPRVTGATSVGTSKFSNLSLGVQTASEIAVLTTGMPLGSEEIHRRNYPGQLHGIVDCLIEVLNSVLSYLEESQDPVATLKGIIENPKNPTLSSFLKSLLGISSLDGVDEGQVNKFKQILRDKVNELGNLRKAYSRQQVLLQQAWVFVSKLGEIIGRKVQFHEDVDKMVKEIFQMLVEVSANYRRSEWREALWPLASRAYRFFGSYSALSNGVPTNESEATGSLEGVGGSRAAILRFIDTVVNTTSSPSQEDKDLFKRLVDAIKELHRVLESTEVAIKKRGVLGISSSWWERKIREKLKEIGLSVEEIVTSDNIEALYEKAKGSLTREKLEEIFSWFRNNVEKAWQDLADKAAKRVSQVVKGLSLTTMPPGKLSEWLEALFRAARVERRRMVPIAEELSPEKSEEGGEEPVILEAPTSATIAEIEDFLFKVLESLASAYKAIGNIASILENFAEAWDKYVAEVGRSEITIDSPEFGRMVGRVLEELLRKDKGHKDFVRDFVIWLSEVKGVPIAGLEGLPKLQGIVSEALGEKGKEEGRVEEPAGGVEGRVEPPFGPEEGTPAPPDLLEEEGSPGFPSGSGEPTESEEEKEKERHLLLKFVFLAKALRVFP
jgi:hypothetical protein